MNGKCNICEQQEDVRITSKGELICSHCAEFYGIECDAVKESQEPDEFYLQIQPAHFAAKVRKTFEKNKLKALFEDILKMISIYGFSEMKLSLYYYFRNLKMANHGN